MATLRPNRTAEGRVLKCLTIVDDATTEAVAERRTVSSRSAVARIVCGFVLAAAVELIAASPASGQSPDGSMVPVASQIVDGQGAVWAIGGGQSILRDGAHAAGGYGSEILWSGGVVYVLGTDNNWWRWLGSGWTNLGATQPGTATGCASPDGSPVARLAPVGYGQRAAEAAGRRQSVLRDASG